MKTFKSSYKNVWKDSFFTVIVFVICGIGFLIFGPKTILFFILMSAFIPAPFLWGVMNYYFFGSACIVLGDDGISVKTVRKKEVKINWSDVHSVWLDGQKWVIERKRAKKLSLWEFGFSDSQWAHFGRWINKYRKQLCQKETLNKFVFIPEYRKGVFVAYVFMSVLALFLWWEVFSRGVPDINLLIFALILMFGLLVFPFVLYKRIRIENLIVVERLFLPDVHFKFDDIKEISNYGIIFQKRRIAIGGMRNGYKLVEMLKNRRPYDKNEFEKYQEKGEQGTLLAIRGGLIGIVCTFLIYPFLLSSNLSICHKYQPLIIIGIYLIFGSSAMFVLKRIK